MNSENTVPELKTAHSVVQLSANDLDALVTQNKSPDALPEDPYVLKHRPSIGSIFFHLFLIVRFYC